MRGYLLGATLFLAGCASTPPGAVSPQGSQPYAMLLFGDHGYDLDYLEADERNPPLTLEQAIAVEREEWAEDKRPPAEFAPSAMIQLPDERAGLAFVFRVFERVSYALIMNITRPVGPLDVVQTP